MKSNKGYANRAKSGDKASIARRSQKAAQARLDKTGRTRNPKRKGRLKDKSKSAANERT
jgi:hypothetical protein